MWKATLIRVVALLIPMTQISCVHSEHPLTDPETCSFDARLVGPWKYVGKDGIEFLFIGRPRDIKNRPEGMMVLNDASLSEQHELFWNPTPSFFFATKVGEVEYLQTFAVSGEYPNEADWKELKVKTFVFLKYKVTKEQLTIWVISPETTATAVKGGLLKGTVQQGVFGDQTTLNENSDGLRRFLEKGGHESLFPENRKLIFQRVK